MENTLSFIYQHPVLSHIFSTDTGYILILFWFLYASLAIFIPAFRKRFSNYYIFESIPGVFVTLGLFGTFLGITAGLFEFNTDPDLIKNSIQHLLSGLKDAFVTSLLGIALSLVFGKLVKYKLSARLIKEPRTPEEEKLEDIASLLQQMIKNTESQNNLQSKKIGELLEGINKNGVAMREKMDEFAENLAKNNVDALMKSIKETMMEFNASFKEFMGELVTQNFNKLTESVDNLIVWQEENKAELKRIKNSYEELHERHEDFIKDTEEWTKIQEKLSLQNEKMNQLIRALSETIIEDDKYKAIISSTEESVENLNGTASALKSLSENLEHTTEAFKETESSVTKWLERESGVRESVVTLANTLEQLREFDIANIEELDRSFINRMQNTLKNFDKLIKEYITYLENNNGNEREAA